ncbi:ghkl domain protein, partial [Vespula squamosa]
QNGERKERARGCKAIAIKGSFVRIGTVDSQRVRLCWGLLTELVRTLGCHKFRIDMRQEPYRHSWESQLRSMVTWVYGLRVDSCWNTLTESHFPSISFIFQTYNHGKILGPTTRTSVALELGPPLNMAADGPSD